MLRKILVALLVVVLGALALLEARAQQPATASLMLFSPNVLFALDDSGRIFRNVPDVGWQSYAQCPTGQPATLWGEYYDSYHFWLGMKNGDTYYVDMTVNPPQFSSQGNVFGLNVSSGKAGWSDLKSKYR